MTHITSALSNRLSGAALRNMILLLLAALSPLLASGQTNTQNWVKKISYKVRTDTAIATPTPSEAQVNVTYFDGLGRPIQKVANRQSATDKDIVQHIEYDEFGRQLKEYLPYVSDNDNMAFIEPEDALDQTLNYAEFDGQPPFSEKSVEASPLGRTLQVAAPGYSWEMASGNTVGMEYTINSAADFQIRILEPGSGNTITHLGYYQNGKLYKTTTTDEGGHSTQEFKNLKGQLVLKRAHDGTGFVDTYYVYDAYDNLVYVIPPAAANATLTTTVLNNLCYQYRYDDRNRLIAKRIPGKQHEEYIVYDALDRIVATGPVTSPLYDRDNVIKGWLLNLYDNNNRVAYTGWFPADFTTTAIASLRATLNAGATNVSKTSTASTIDGATLNYTISTLPLKFALLTVNYYDDYDFPGAPVSFSHQVGGQDIYYNNTAGTKPIGLPTGSWVRVLTGQTAIGETSYIFYDYDARAIGTGKTNYLGGYTQTETTFNDAGQTVATLTKHKRNNTANEISVTNLFTYTRQGRPLLHTHNIGGTATVMRMAENSYSPLGRLLSKQTGTRSLGAYMQNINYSYNIRGWLTGINDVNDLSTDNPDSPDLFAFKINYDTTEGNLTNINPQYNGNISETYWRSKSDNILRKYSYIYDALNRYTDAVYQKPDASVPETMSYNESVAYDSNGNIVTLNRTGNLDVMGDTIIIDDLTYTYTAGTNQLLKVSDGTNSPAGFKDNTGSSAYDYKYDGEGNMTFDRNKGITSIEYNYLNLPDKIVFSSSATTKISYIYNALGEKVAKEVTNGSVIVLTDYLDGFQYVGTVLKLFPTSEGYVSNTVAAGTNNYRYVFNYLDHLGNVRLSYSQDTKGRQIMILEESHYYPYGLKHTNYNPDILAFMEDGEGGEGEGDVILVPVESADANKYKFNGQEWQDELGLNMTAMDFRQYDNAIGRFISIDALSEINYSQSPYHFANNNPVYFSDPTGLDDIIIDMNTVQSGTTINFLYTQSDVDNAVGDLYLGNEEGGLTYIENSLGMVTVQAGGASWRTHANLTIQSHVYSKSRFYEGFRDRQFSGQLDNMQSVLDAIGTIDPFGIVDAGNSLLYLARGQRTNAAIAAIGILPYLGDAAKAGKYFNKAEKIISKDLKYQKRVLEAVDTFHNFPASFDKEIIKNGSWSQRLKDGADWYELKGTINNVDGVYQIGINSSDEIFHRAFLPY